MFYDLPREIQIKIFCLEPTKRENFEKVLHQIRFIPVLYQLKKKVDFFSTWHWRPSPWWFWFLKLHRNVVWKSDMELRSVLVLFWKRYFWKKLRRY